MHNDKDEKLSIRRILSNYAYLLKYSFRIDAVLIIQIFTVLVASGVGHAFMDTIFIRAFINYLSDSNVSFQQTAVLVVVSTLGIAVLMSLERCTESLARPRIIRMTGRMQEEMIQKVSEMDLICYDSDTYYDNFVIAASQLEEIAVMVIMDLARMGSNVAAVLVLSGLITFINPVIAIFPTLGFIINVYTKFRIMKLEYDCDVEKKRIMRRANYSKRVFYQPEYAKEIKLSHIEVPLERQFHQSLDETVSVVKKYGMQISLWSFINYISVYTLLSAYCVPLYLGYMALVVCRIGLGDVAALNNAQSSVRNQLDSLNYCVERVQKAGMFCERFRRFMDYEGKIENAAGITQVPWEHTVLEIKDVSYRYAGSQRDTLRHINMKIKSGEKVAIVGENGAGKSTFVKLLMRLYDVTEGSICYGGHDIREFTTKEYRKIFGSVFQDYQLYATTVKENVIMGEGKGDVPEEKKRVEEALRQSGFWERLESLPEGMDTPLTREFAENGVSLSGGEAQKVAIGRLFAKKDEMHIAILDEPSSALDPRAEYELNQNMLHKAGEATVIFISHRLSTTKDADCIYMFENGEIIEQGSHRELMEQNGQYAEMFRCQAKYYQQNQEITV